MQCTCTSMDMASKRSWQLGEGTLMAKLDVGMKGLTATGYVM